jgi:hypothetical protein
MRYRDSSNPRLREAFAEGAAHYDWPKTHPLRGIVDVSRPRSERMAFGAGWRHAHAKQVSRTASNVLRPSYEPVPMLKPERHA